MRDRSQPDRSFPRSVRLTARKQFLTVYRDGLRVRTPTMTVFGRPNDVGVARVGITATRKVGNAVRRNRLKRIVRDVFRRHRQRLHPGVDWVVNLHARTELPPYAAFERDFLDATRRAQKRLSRSDNPDLKINPDPSASENGPGRMSGPPLREVSR